MTDGTMLLTRDDLKSLLTKQDYLETVEDAFLAHAEGRTLKPKRSSFVLQRRIMLALKKDIDRRAHGRLLRRVRYYCDVLLRE